MFKTFWCEGKNHSLKKLFNTKEMIFAEVLSVENISRLYFEFYFIKMLIFDSNENKKIQDIYTNILSENVNIKSLRKVIYEKENQNISLMKWMRLENEEKIDFFL